MRSASRFEINSGRPQMPNYCAGVRAWRLVVKKQNRPSLFARRNANARVLFYVPTCFFKISESLIAGSFGANSSAFLKEAVASSCLPILSKVSAIL